MVNISISLAPELVEMIRVHVESGRYASTSEVVRDALRLLAEEGGKQATGSGWLRQAWVEGIESEDAGQLSFSDLKAEARRRLACQTSS